VQSNLLSLNLVLNDGTNAFKSIEILSNQYSSWCERLDVIMSLRLVAVPDEPRDDKVDYFSQI